MRPYLSSLLAVVLVVGACGGGSADGGDAGPLTAVAPADVQIDTSTIVTTPQGPIVPDFTMTLADGTRFDLADVDTPLYVMFWAEW